MILDSDALQKMFSLLERGDEKGIMRRGVQDSPTPKYNRGRKQIAAIDGIEQVMNWLKENADDADQQCPAVLVFQHVFGSQVCQGNFRERSSGLGLGHSVRRKSTATMASGINLLEHICKAMPEQCAAQIKSGIANRLLQMFISQGTTGRRGSAHV